jgi:chromosome segregation ATPase
MSAAQSPTESYAELAGKRDTAQHRVEELEAEQRAAAQAHQQLRAALVEAERRGARPAEIRKLEEQLTAAEAKPKVLAARIEGARHAVRDTDIELARFVHGNLTELVAPLAEEGKLVAAKINAAAEAIVTGLHEREAIAQRISSLSSMVGRVQPGDVTRTACEEVANAAQRLLQRGGEAAPELLRDPRQPEHGEAAA